VQTIIANAGGIGSAFQQLMQGEISSSSGSSGGSTSQLIGKAVGKALGS
jgi:hypothetical protein